MVLNPEWITESVYKILLDKNQITTSSNGSFTYGYIQDLLDYDNVDIILRLMQKFNLCFKLREEDEKYIVPQLLMNKEPIERIKWDFSNNLFFEYQYYYLANGTIERFISKAYSDKLVEKNLYWKSGVILNWENKRALIEADLINDRIKVYIKGNRPSKLLDFIRKDFKSINEKSTVEKEQIKCICKNCRSSYDINPSYFEFSILEDMKRKGIERIQCMNSYVFIRIEDILEHKISDEGTFSKDTIINLVSNNEIENALIELNLIFREKGDVEKITTIAHLSSQWKEIIRNETLGIEGSNEITKRKNQVKYNVLELVNK